MKSKFVLASLIATQAFSFVCAELKPASVFTDKAVLQRDAKVPVWGTADPGASVTVALGKATDNVAKESVSAKADKDGNWMVWLTSRPADTTPHIMTISSGEESVQLNDLLFGDVWICAGQSNMEMSYHWGLTKGKTDIENNTYPLMRLLYVPNRTHVVPQASFDAAWQECTPENAKRFSAVGYFFGAALQRAMPDVPVGLIDATWSGTVAETWLSLDNVAKVPGFEAAAAQHRQIVEAWYNGGAARYEEAVAEWTKAIDPLSVQTPPPQSPAFDDAGWQEVALPTMMEKSIAPNFDGVVWYRTDVELTAAQAAKTARITLGAIDDEDVTYINGVKVGALTRANASRDYAVKQGLLKAGKNSIVVRAQDSGGPGGFSGKPENLKLVLGDETVSLAKTWRYHATSLGANKKPQDLSRPDANSLAACYNGMVTPLFPLAIKGAIWYQGCSNVGRHVQYYDLLGAVIDDWRANFSGGDFPFYITQLSAFVQTSDTPRESAWAAMRWVQMRLGEDRKNSGTAVTIDIGDHTDIHPKNKKDVGERLARLALVRTHGKTDIVEAGPIPVAVSKAGENSLRVTFKNADGISGRDGEAITGFQVAGTDGKFAWATAIVDANNDIMVSSADVAQPVRVRYAWDDYPACNLVNAEGLPCGPFQLSAK